MAAVRFENEYGSHHFSLGWFKVHKEQEWLLDIHWPVFTPMKKSITINTKSCLILVIFIYTNKTIFLVHEGWVDVSTEITSQPGMFLEHELYIQVHGEEFRLAWLVSGCNNPINPLLFPCITYIYWIKSIRGTTMIPKHEKKSQRINFATHHCSILWSKIVPGLWLPILHEYGNPICPNKSCCPTTAMKHTIK